MKKFATLLIAFLTIPFLTSCDALTPGGSFTPGGSESQEDTKNNFTITWLNYNGNLLSQTTVSKNTMPSYNGNTPYHPGENGVTYEFSGWSPNIVAARSDATYVAQFIAHPDEDIQPIDEFTVTWANYNGMVLSQETYSIYSWPSYKGNTPRRASENGYSYEFTGWSPTLNYVTADVTYVAQYSVSGGSQQGGGTSDQKYTVLWVNYDGSVLERGEYYSGEYPSYHGNTPTRPDDNDYTYMFSTWSPAVENVSENATYVAQYDRYERQGEQLYTVTWVNYNGTLLDSGTYHQGDSPEYNGPTPTKQNEAGYSYSFSGWSPEIHTVNGDATYVAQFVVNEAPQSDTKYTVIFADWNGQVLQSGEYDLGDIPSYNGPTPTRPDENGFEYTFACWSPTIGQVTKDITYVAQYDWLLKRYTVTWKDSVGDYTFYSETYIYGELPIYHGETPRKQSDSAYNYTFTGWYPGIENVARDITYTAQYNNELRMYTVRWIGHFGVLEEDSCQYGEAPMYNGPAIEDYEEGGHHYSFVDWGRELVAVDGDTDYIANYSSTPIEYTVTWKNSDGTVLDTEIYYWDDIPSYKGSTPQYPGDPIRYEFNSWYPTPTNVWGDQEYTATYNQLHYDAYAHFCDYQGNERSGYSMTSNPGDIRFPSDIYNYIPEVEEDYYYEFTGWQIIGSDVWGGVTYGPKYEKKDAVDNLYLVLSQDKSHYIVTGAKEIPASGQVGIPAVYNGLSINEIGNKAFTSLNESLKQVKMSNNITTIGDYAFSSDWSANISLSNSIRFIGDYAFLNVTRFEEVNLPEVETIGECAFESCYFGGTINIGRKLQSFGYCAFDCFGKEFVVDSNNMNFESVDGVMYTRGKSELVQYPAYRESQLFELPLSVTSIGPAAFRSLQFLSTIDFGTHVQKIGYMAFSNNSTLASISIPESITEFEEGIFNGCRALTEVSFPSNFTMVPDAMFEYCEALEEVFLPEGITKIGNYSFKNCSKLKQVYFFENDAWSSGNDTMTEIGFGAFMYCKKLKMFPYSSILTTIGGQAFYSCTSLSSIDIPQGVEVICAATFMECTNLTEVILPPSIIRIEAEAFRDVPYLYEITFAGSMKKWNQIDLQDWRYNCPVSVIHCGDGDITL